MVDTYKNSYNTTPTNVKYPQWMKVVVFYVKEEYQKKVDKLVGITSNTNRNSNRMHDNNVQRILYITE